MTALPYATFREDVSDAADALADFSRVAADLECYLDSARRSAYAVLGASMPEIDELKADVLALVAKADKLQSLVRTLGRRAERGMIACSACNGEGEIESEPHGYDPRDGALLTHSRVCDACDGSGVEEIEVQPVELEDFDDGLAQHTPGPWKVEENPVIDREHLIIPAHQSIGDGGAPCVWIASVHSQGDDEDPDAPPPRQARANANLIAAAPELLAALQVVATAELYDPATGIIDADVLEAVQEKSRAAIAKAEGRS